jgi:aminopeptidase N
VREWRDVCISECFASYAPWLWDEAKDGVDLDARYREQVTQFSAFPGFWSGTLYDMGPYQEFAYPVYLRGPLALHALRHQIGEPAFDALLRAWPARHRYGNAGWLEFEALASTISGQDLRGFFDAWVRGTDVPPAQYLWPGTLTP